MARGLSLLVRRIGREQALQPRLFLFRQMQKGGISRAAVYRQSTAKDQSALRMRIRDITLSRPRFGCPRIRMRRCV